MARVKDAYEEKPSEEFLRIMKFHSSERERIDFPDPYSWNDVEGYAQWFYETLEKYEKLKQRVN